jgi:hypothetical protein
MGCELEYEVSPSSANLCELVPPPFLDPSLLLLLILLLLEARFDIFHFSQTNRPIEIKDVEKRVIVEDVDGCIMWSVTSLILEADESRRRREHTPRVGTHELVGLG